MTKLAVDDLIVNLTYDEYNSGPHYKSYLGYSKASQLAFVFTYDEYILRNGNIGYMGEKLITIDLTNGTTEEVGLFCN